MQTLDGNRIFKRFVPFSWCRKLKRFWADSSTLGQRVQSLLRVYRGQYLPYKSSLTLRKPHRKFYSEYLNLPQLYYHVEKSLCRKQSVISKEDWADGILNSEGGYIRTTFCPCAVHGQFGVIHCTCHKVGRNLNKSGRRVKMTDLRGSRTTVQMLHITWLLPCSLQGHIDIIRCNGSKYDPKLENCG